ARRYGVPVIDRAKLSEWQREADRRTLYVPAGRDPAEYRVGHLPGSLMAPGGQLVQETDSWLGVWGARVVLVDDTGVRARMTASWLRRMGWDAVVLEGGLDGAELEHGVPAPARDRPPAERERYMPEYLAWEIDLVNQIARDADCRFRLSPVAAH